MSTEWERKVARAWGFDLDIRAARSYGAMSTLSSDIEHALEDGEITQEQRRALCEVWVTHHNALIALNKERRQRGRNAE